MKDPTDEQTADLFPPSLRSYGAAGPPSLAPRSSARQEGEPRDSAESAAPAPPTEPDRQLSLLFAGGEAGRKIISA